MLKEIKQHLYQATYHLKIYMDVLYGQMHPHLFFFPILFKPTLISLGLFLKVAHVFDNFYKPLLHTFLTKFHHRHIHAA